MFEHFTDRAKRVVVFAQEEAGELDHNYVGTEHILLGLIREGDGIAAGALRSMNVALDEVRTEVEVIVGRGQAAPTRQIPFTPRAKKVLELSLREALQLGQHNPIGTEHILLGLIREGEGVAAQVLRDLGVDLDRARQAVMDLMPPRAAYGYETPEEAARGDIPAQYSPALFTELSPDENHALVVLSTNPGPNAELYEVLCFRSGDRWFGASGSNGLGGWTSTDFRAEPNVGVMRVGAEVPPDVRSVIIRWRGQEHSAPVSGGYFLFVGWDVPVDSAEPEPEAVRYVLGDGSERDIAAAESASNDCDDAPGVCGPDLTLPTTGFVPWI